MAVLFSELSAVRGQYITLHQRYDLGHRDDIKVLLDGMLQARGGHGKVDAPKGILV